jgi:hypothetical protein
MATRKPTKPAAKAPAKPKLQNLAARPTNFDDTVDDGMMVDNSGVFRVTAALQQAQTGHDEEQGMRFANESLVMRAQRENLRDEGTTLDEAVEETTTEDEASAAIKRQRLATLAARNQARTRRR